MLQARWSIISPLSPSKLTDRILSAPRWDGWRHGFHNGRFLIAERQPVHSGVDGFRFEVPLNPQWPVVVSGTFHAAGETTRIEMRATPPSRLLYSLLLVTTSITVVPLVGLWSVSPWLAIVVAVAPCLVVVPIVGLGFWLSIIRAQKRVNELLMAP